MELELRDKPMPKPTNQDVLNQMYGDKPKTIKKSAHHSEVELKDWEWMQFLGYWDDRYLEVLQMIPPGHPINKFPVLKSMIEFSVKQWGRDIFKAMIDYVFDNIAYYPKWNNINIGLVCGSHYWANFIANEVQKGL